MFLQDGVAVQAVQAVQALPARRLKLTFSDRREGVVAVDAIVSDYGGVFAPLRDPAFFDRVRADAELGTVVWPNGADLCPDVLYAHATGQQARLPACVP